MQSQVKRRIAFGITTGGLLAGGGLGVAHADAAGTGSGTAGTAGGSPGILSGNSVQIPVDIPINVCGLTANLVGVLNPAAHNSCVNDGGATASGGGATASGGGATTGGATAIGGTSGSPGILSGNNVQVPVHIPVNACGDSVNVVGVGNGALDNHCANHGGDAAPGAVAGAAGGTAGSPGILSGNNVQAPVHVPVNVCGDTVNVVGVGNPALGNHCANHGGATAVGGSGTGGSPGILSGNNVQIPVSVPVNLCGNHLGVVAVGNTAADNHCANEGGATAITLPPPPVTTSTPPGTTATPPPGAPAPHTAGETPGVESVQPAGTGSLAHTGAGGLLLAPIGAALMGGGLVMVRKFKPTRSH